MVDADKTHAAGQATEMALKMVFWWLTRHVSRCKVCRIPSHGKTVARDRRIATNPYGVCATYGLCTKKGNRMVGIDKESGWIEVLPFNDRTTQTVKNICQESLTIIKKQNQSNSKAVKKTVNYEKEHEFVSDYFKA